MTSGHLFLVGHRQPADVIRRALPVLRLGLEVDAPEAQRGIADVERREAPPGHLFGGLPLQPGLVRAAPPHFRVAEGDPPGGVTHGVEPLVRGIDVLLLGHQLGLGHGANSGSGEPSSLPAPERRSVQSDVGVVTVSVPGSSSSSGSPSRKPTSVTSNQRPPRFGIAGDRSPTWPSTVRMTPTWVTTSAHASLLEARRDGVERRQHPGEQRGIVLEAHGALAFGAEPRVLRVDLGRS